jgi:hypothetical protein
MNNLKYITSMFSMPLMVVCLYISASGQTAEDINRLATVSGAGSSVRWDVSAANAGGTVTILAPDGRVFRVETKSGAAAEFMLSDKQGNRLPDGQYTYELRLTPELSKAVKEQLAAARGKDDDPEDVRAARKRVGIPALVESGSFSIVNGAVIVAGAEEGSARRVSKISEQRLPGLIPAVTETKNQMHHPLMIAKPDDVIPDDLIVQGSACVGLDCVNGEVFGFDTIRVKENNTRIQFDDTSGAGFPTNNWQIRANSSAGGGASFLGFVDQGATGNSETGTVVFEVDAGAPANSLKVSSTGRVGLRTATPVLDLHIATGDTPAHRLEQTNGSGFTAQTWDIAGNEANFFVRDVTSGSRLPFRIRPGAPTSSIDISASGNVGIGTASPGSSLDVAGNIFNVGSEAGTSNRTNNTTKLARVSMPPFASASLPFALFAGATTSTANIAAFGGEVGGMAAATQVDFVTAAGTNVDSGTVRMTINSAGNVGIATGAPTATLSVNGTANKPGGGSWDIFSDERLKNIKGSFTSGLKAVMQLQPLRYEYKQNNALGIKSEGEHIGFGAQAVQKIIPEAVTATENGYLQVNNDPILWTMLNAIKEQQKEIEQLKGQIKQLRARSHRRR